jgi:ribosomal protein L7/L12
VRSAERRADGNTTRVPGVDYTLIGLVTAVILVLVAVSTAVSRRETERHQIRLALIERKLDAVLDHLGVEVPEPHLQQVEAMLRRGKTIEAIKAYREATGAGLREAKEAVDRISARG